MAVHILRNRFWQSQLRACTAWFDKSLCQRSKSAIEYSKLPKQQSAALQQAQSHIRFNATQTRHRPHNKTLQPTAYSSVRSSLRFQRRLNSVVVAPHQLAAIKAGFDRTLSVAFSKAAQLLVPKRRRTALALSAPRTFNLSFHQAADRTIHSRCFRASLMLESTTRGASAKRQYVTRQRRHNKALQPTRNCLPTLAQFANARLSLALCVASYSMHQNNRVRSISTVLCG
jgi:hypothetical protein